MAAWFAVGSALALPTEWQHVQHFEAGAGLVKFSLPPETLDAATFNLADLRLFDNSGREIPWLVEQITMPAKAVRPARFESALGPSDTTVMVEVPNGQPIEAVSIQTPAQSFIKATRLEGSSDGSQWTTLAEGRPLFSRPDGTRQLQLGVQGGPWKQLRIVLDDRRSPPVPITGASLHFGTGEPASAEPFAVVISDRNNNSRDETRLTLQLGAANLQVASLEIETPEPLFTRQAALLVTAIAPEPGAAAHEQAIADASLYRVSVDGRSAVEHLILPVHAKVPSREAVLLIRNHDSPPLQIASVKGRRLPVFLIFHAPAPGTYHLLTGNSRCPMPQYDLALLRGELKNLPVSSIQLSALEPNPDYRDSDPLPGLQPQGAALDVKAWSYRKPIGVTNAGTQQLELDLDILSHAQAGFGDLRVVENGQQVPYILERTSLERSLAPTMASRPSRTDTSVTEWELRLPRPRLPIATLTCSPVTALFKRSVTLYEEVQDERGAKYRRALASAEWVQTPDQPGRELRLSLQLSPETDTWILETPNGDNPPIELRDFRACYAAVRLLFKPRDHTGLYIYYGNPQAMPPDYDLRLVAEKLRASDRRNASLGQQEQLRKAGASSRTGSGGVLLWTVLAGVVIALLAIISRLLPKAPK